MRARWLDVALFPFCAKTEQGRYLAIVTFQGLSIREQLYGHKKFFRVGTKQQFLRGPRQAHAAHSTGQSGQSEHKIRFILPPREARRIKMYMVKICKSHLP